MEKIVYFCNWNMDKDFGKERNTGRLIKVYRSMVIAGLMSLLAIGVAAAFLYAVLACDAQWWHWVIFPLGIIVPLYYASTWLRHFGDRILVFENGVILTHAERKTIGDEWESVRDEYIPWHDIRRFDRTEEMVTASIIDLHVRRWIWINTRGDNVYRVSPDPYDTFFLEKKMQRYWKEHR